MNDWVAERMGLHAPPTAAERDAYQLARIRETVAHARSQSPFYRTRRKWPETLPTRLDDMTGLPFTWPEDLIRNDPPLVAAPRDAIARMVTLDTSGTTGRPKRIAFAAADVEDTIDYFRHGMARFTRPDDRVGIVFPSSRPGSIGEDLIEASRRLGAMPLTLPPGPLSAETLLSWIRGERPDVLFGPPVPLLAAARLSHADGGPVPAIRAALISSEAAPRALIEALRRLWGCEVFDHWGMTETGYGGALDCACHTGAHVRETALFLEIVDPLSGAPRPPGAEGEIVLTTLRRTCLPLIRYRTGDLGRLIEAPCACGSVLRRLVGLGRRIGGAIPLAGGKAVSRIDLDETLFALPTVTDYTARIEDGTPAVLRIELAAAPDARTATSVSCVRHDLLADAAIGPAVAKGDLILKIAQAEATLLAHAGKRRVTRVRQGTWPWAVFFDLDGTLVHTLPAVRAALNDTLTAFGRASLAQEDVARIVGGGARTLLERATREQGEPLSPDERNEMLAHYLARYPGYEARLSAAFPGSLDTIRSLAEEGRGIAIVTNKRTRDAEVLVNRLGLSGWISAVVGGDAALCGKPDPDLLLIACRRLGCEVSEALFVGDGHEDQVAARSIAMPFLHIHRTGSGMADAAGDPAFSGLTGLGPLLSGGASI